MMFSSYVKTNQSFWGGSLKGGTTQWLFPKVKEAYSMAALLRMLRHRMPTSTVPMLRTLGNSHPFFTRDFTRDFSRMHRWILNETKYPQPFAFTRCVGYLQIASGKQYTLLYTSEVLNVFRNNLCRIAFYRLIM